MRIALAICLICLGMAQAIRPASAGPALVFDAKTGEVLLADRAGEPWHPASITKIMTAYLTFRAIRAGQLQLTSKINISRHAAQRPASKIGLRAGTKVSVDFALRALLIHSANDMAVVLAEAVGGSEPAFVARMNATAKRLGMTGSYFANPHGLNDTRQIITARDMGILAATVYNEFPVYRHYFSAPAMRVGKRRLRNRNKLLRQMKAATGMKTGFICASGYNLVASANMGGRTLMAIVLGAKSGKGRFDFAQVLLESAAKGARAGAGINKTRIGQLVNQPFGRSKPKNLRSVVCRKASRVAWGKVNDLSGWGVSLGRFKSVYTADAVLQGRLLASRRIFTGGTSGVFRVPFSREYIALISSMKQPNTLTFCNYLRQRSDHCEVITPEAFAEFVKQKALYALQRKSKRKTTRRRKKRRRLKTAGDRK